MRVKDGVCSVCGDEAVITHISGRPDVCQLCKLAKAGEGKCTPTQRVSKPSREHPWRNGYDWRSLR
jgi:hypothetical protein